MERTTDERLKEIEKLVRVAERKWQTEPYVRMLRELLEMTQRWKREIGRLQAENEKMKRERALEQDARSTEV